MQMSVFTPYSYGLAAENYDLENEGMLEVAPMEILPVMDGELSPDSVKLETKGVDENGDVYETSIDLDTTLPCKWIGGGNSIIPPNVRRGERLMVYRLGNSSKFFWTTLGMDQNLRRLETIILAISGNPNNADQSEVNTDNSYFIEISTHKKLITAKTSMLNGEKAGYTLQLNTGEGTLNIEDDKGNKLFWDSVNTFFEAINVDKTRITINKKLIDVFAEESISYETNVLNVKANDKIMIFAENLIDVATKVFNMAASDSITMTTKATTLDSSDTIDFTCKTFTTEASSAFNLKAGEITAESDANINMKAGGMLNMEAGAMAAIKAPMITLDGEVVATMNMAVTGAVGCAALAAAGGAAGMDASGAMSAASIETTGASTLGAVTCASLSSTGPIDGNPVLSGGSPVLKA